MRGIDGEVLEQLRGRRRRHRKAAMGAVDEATPDIHRGAIPAVHIERVRGGCAAGNIHDGVDRTHFVEMNFLR